MGQQIVQAIAGDKLLFLPFDTEYGLWYRDFSKNQPQCCILPRIFSARKSVLCPCSCLDLCSILFPTSTPNKATV